jgi:hypothetical protein
MFKQCSDANEVWEPSIVTESLKGTPQSAQPDTPRDRALTGAGSEIKRREWHAPIGR